MEEGFLLSAASPAEVVGVFCRVVLVEVALQFEPMVRDFECGEFVFGERMDAFLW